jgi:predicted dehydrogenase
MGRRRRAVGDNQHNNDETMTNLSIAIIGAGFIADYHVNGLRAAGGAEVAVLVGRDRGRTEVRAGALGIARVETDIDAVLGNSSIDAVVIATPDNTHRDIAIAALEAGKPVLVQKPMAMSAAEGREMLAARERTGTPLSVSFMHRYFAESLWLKREIDSGRLGKIHGLRIRNATPGADWSDWLYAPGAVAGGVLMQLGVHGIDLVQHLFGPIVTVSAATQSVKPRRRMRDGRVIETSIEDAAQALYGFVGGFGGSHEMSYTELAGTSRFRLEMTCDKGTVWLRTGRGPAAMFAPELTGTRDWVSPDLVQEAEGAAHHRDWLDVVRTGRDDGTAAAGISSLVVAEAIYGAAAAGMRVNVGSARR